MSKSTLEKSQTELIIIREKPTTYILQKPHTRIYEYTHLKLHQV